MVPEVQTNTRTNTQVRPSVEQEQLASELPRTAPLFPPADTIEATREKWETPPVAAPPAPPRGGLAASIQRIPPTGRWLLGIGLAFLSGVAFVFGPYISNFGPAVFISAIAAMFVLALAAGFVLSNWWAALALAIAGAVGGLSGIWLLLQIASGEGSGSVVDITGVLSVSVWFAVMGLGPLILLLFAGVGLGRRQGLTLGQPHALSITETSVSRWIAVIAPLIAAGYLATNVIYIQGDAMSILTGSIYAVVLATTCLLAGWLLRSWRGGVLAPVVYVGATFLTSQIFSGGFGGGYATLWARGFALYIVLPAVVMSAIGTAIGMLRARRRE